MRALPLLVLTACAARAPVPPAAAPELVPHAVSVGTVSLFDGEITEDFDWGREGQRTIETRADGRLQELNWGEVVDDLDERARGIWRVSRGFGAQLGANSIAEEPVLGKAVVEGQPATTWEMVVGGDKVLLALWTCPRAGATVSLVTAGPAAWAPGAHAASVASATCAKTPLALDLSSIAWEWVAGPEWQSQPAPTDGPGSAMWRRADGGAIVNVTATTVVRASPGVDPCRSMMDEIVEGLREAYAIDPASVQSRDVGICSRTFSGTVNEQPVRAVVTEHACDERRAYLTFCLLIDPEAPLDTCDSLVRCRD